MEQLGITLVKGMPYRDKPIEEWSNTYWFNGPVATTQAEADAYVHNLAAAEAQLLLGYVTYIRAYVFSDTSLPLHSAFLVEDTALTSISGAFSASGTTFPAGDQCGMIRWSTGRRNTKGRPVYLRKYLHAVPTEEDVIGTKDTVNSVWMSAAATFANNLATISSGHGTITARGHLADNVSSHKVDPYIRIRQLRKGVRRPPA